MVTVIPGVFIDESNAEPPWVQRVGTSEAAFIGYCKKAEHMGQSLLNVPCAVASMAEFEQRFGDSPAAPLLGFSLAAAPLGGPHALTLAGANYALTQTHGFYLLHRAMQLYFQNGGGRCWVVCVGGFVGGFVGSVAPGLHISASALIAGLRALESQAEPAVVLIPECVLLPQADCETVQQQLLTHCGLTMKSRFAILDIREGWRAQNDASFDCVQAFRSAIGEGMSSASRAFGAAYYPWLNTDIVPARTLGFQHLVPDSLITLMACLQRELPTLKLTKLRRTRLQAELNNMVNVPASNTKAHAALAKRWAAISPAFNAVTTEMARQLNLLPPSAAVAGAFATNDTRRGVWKAPANIALAAVTSPAVLVPEHDQAALNIDAIQGKSVNAIRAFPGQGVLIWGGRTLDGNSNDWRYINVRRTVSMVEQSAQRALAAFVFEPNNAATWVRVQSMMQNFLIALWSDGALAGAKLDEAGFVRVGLNLTMNQADVSAGLMRIELGLALSRPAEFIVILLTQQVQIA
jgi:uncharacterized protein